MDAKRQYLRDKGKFTLAYYWDSLPIYKCHAKNVWPSQCFRASFWLPLLPFPMLLSGPRNLNCQQKIADLEKYTSRTKREIKRF